MAVYNTCCGQNKRPVNTHCKFRAVCLRCLACEQMEMGLKKVGLTLGKFAPLHKGHQFLIETALAEMDEVIVMIYATEVTHIPLNVRAAWLRELYPSLTVIECWDNPSDTVSNEREHEIREEDYIVHKLAGRHISHFYCSEYYGEHVSRRLNAEDRRVDEARRHVPISATQIRAQPYRYREFVHPRVYWDMLLKCVFVGTVSAGKTTLVEALAAHQATVGVPEYGRVYWAEHQHNRRLQIEELDTIVLTHQQWEYELAHEAQDVVFVDTNALTTRLFCIDYHGKSTPRLRPWPMPMPAVTMCFLCAKTTYRMTTLGTEVGRKNARYYSSKFAPIWRGAKFLIMKYAAVWPSACAR